MEEGLGERGIAGEVFPADGNAGLRMNQEEEYTARDGEDAEKRVGRCVDRMLGVGLIW